MDIGSIVGSIVLGLITNGLHTRLENIIDKKLIKKVIARLEEESHSKITTCHMDEVYYNALDLYITENDIVPMLVQVCYYKNNPKNKSNYLTVNAFVEKHTELFVKQNMQYSWLENTFINIFKDLYNTINSALNIPNESERITTNIVTDALKETEHTLSSKIDELINPSTPTASPKPTPPPHIHPYITTQAPPITNEFIHRSDMVEDLHNALKQNKKLALISGLGGIGKTTIAKALFHEVKDEYNHVAWVEYQHSIKESFLNSFLLFNDVDDATERYRKITNFLLDATKDTIIFIDNVSGDDVRGLGFIEQLSANIVLTSRENSIGNFELFTVDFLSEEQCVDIFYKYYKYDMERTQKAAVRKLVELVKCHTLSVELLARAANRPGYSLEVFAADLKDKGFEYPKFRSVETHHTKISKTIAAHLIKLFELLSVNDEQKRILVNFSFMPSVEIPAEVETWIDCAIDDITRLTDLGWLTVSETGYEMHPIIGEAIRLQYKEVMYEDFESIIGYMSSDEYISDTDISTKAHPRLNIAESLMSYFMDFETEEIGLLFNQIGFIYSHHGNYPKALEWYQKALDINEKALGLEHPDTAASYNNIAAVHDSLGDYNKALDGYQKAIDIEEKVLGLEHPDTAASYNNIAAVHSRLGDYKKALDGFQKAFDIREKVLGLEHPDTADSYNNIAYVHSRQGDYKKALDGYQKAFDIREKVLGLEHPDTADSYNDIAYVHSRQGDYKKALDGYQKAFDIREKVLGLEHPDTAASYNNIAYVHSRQGDYKKALDGYQKAFDIREKVLGLEHPDTAESYNNIAAVHYSLGDYNKALDGFQKAFDIREKVLGLEHPDTAASYNNIAYVHYSQGDYQNALDGCRKALAIYERMLGTEHPRTITLNENIAYIRTLLN